MNKQYATLAAVIAVSLMGSSALAAPPTVDVKDLKSVKNQTRKADAKAAAAEPTKVADAKTKQVDDDDDDQGQVQVLPPPQQQPQQQPPAQAQAETPPPPRPEPLGVDAPPGEDDGTKDLLVRPYALVTGGMKYDAVHDKPEEARENRVATFALGRLGLRARWKDWVYAESEFMASGGIGMHGTSAYEGQAAMQVRQQLIRIGNGAWRIEAGRFIDPASVDFYSQHVAESFLQDTATRDALLYTGFNLGNGVRGQYEIYPGLKLGLTFNAGNPVSTTASLMIGGSFPPFERFYTQPYQAVNQGPNHFPDDTFHIMIITPAVMLDTKYIDAKLALQRFDVNTNMNRQDDAHILGYNLRGTARLKLLDGMVVPFASGAFTQNDTMKPNDLATRAAERYRAIDIGGGADVNYARRYKCSYDCADGIGVQYQNVQYQVGEGIVTTNRYLNVGTTYWLAPNVALGARFAMWFTEVAGQASVGERSGIVALRFVMQ
jgi:hypothetical protein